MAKAKKRQRPEPEEAEDDDEEVGESTRDYVMARLMAARAAAQSAITAIDDAANFFINPDQDDDGSEREELITEAAEALGTATRAIEAAEAELEHIDPEEGEPWEDEEED